MSCGVEIRTGVATFMPADDQFQWLVQEAAPDGRAPRGRNPIRWLERLRSSLTERAWNMTQDTLLTWPRSVSTSHAFVSVSTVQHAESRQIHLGWFQQRARVVHATKHTTAMAEVSIPTVHAPELDLAVVGARHDERQCRVEGRPVNAAVVALQHILHHCVAAAKKVRVHLQHGRRRVSELQLSGVQCRPVVLGSSGCPLGRIAAAIAMFLLSCGVDS